MAAKRKPSPDVERTEPDDQDTFVDKGHGDTQRRANAAGSVKAKSAPPHPTELAQRTSKLSQAQLRTAFLIETLGSASAVAELLDVSRSQLGNGEHRPGYGCDHLHS